MHSVDTRGEIFAAPGNQTCARCFGLSLCQLRYSTSDRNISDEHCNRFKSNVGETSESWGEAHMGFSERIDTLLN